MILTDKLMKIQALIDKASSEGEQQAALLAKERILKRQDQEPKEFLITLHSIWQKLLLIALCKKYELHTYRYPKQKHTTTMVLVSPAFLDDILWPEYLKYSGMLQDLIFEVANSVIKEIEKGAKATHNPN